ncbi:MAG: Na/Pi symporter [Calditrichaceae bacterium]
MSPETREKILKALTIIITIYLFLLSIKLLGHSFKLFGKDFAEAMLQMTSNPFTGLIIGIVSTSIIQSSSTTTSIVVGLVAGGVLNLDTAIPIIMGANIGTTITNALVSFGHIGRKAEFRRAFPAAIVHDFFNLFTVILFFPIELKFHIIAKSATYFESVFSGIGGMKMFNPLKFILNPAMDLVDSIFAQIPYYNFVLMIFSILLLFGALTFLVKTIRSLVLDKLEIIINNYLFRNDFLSLILGILMTAIVQSSSVTTSLIIPLAGAGVISIRQIFPYTLGANIGTTVTAILAALATQNHIAITVAFSHLCFNIFGIMVFYPLKMLPIGLAEYVGERASKSRLNLIIFIIGFLMIYIIPLLIIIFN